jgi:hypothetical protein
VGGFGEGFDDPCGLYGGVSRIVDSELRMRELGVQTV